MSQLGLFNFEVPPPQPVATDRPQRPKRSAIETAEAIAQYRALIEKHHAAMLAGDVTITAELRKDAYDIAERMNGDDKHFGIKGGPDAPCYVLERATAAPVSTVPLWGQTGEFIIDVDGTRVRIVMEGMFGIGGSTIHQFHRIPQLFRDDCRAVRGHDSRYFHRRRHSLSHEPNEQAREAGKQAGLYRQRLCPARTGARHRWGGH